MTIAVLLILVLLMCVFVQDMTSRSVYWFLFPALTVLFIITHILAKQPPTEWLEKSVWSLAFLTLQVVLLWGYFSLKNRRLINIADGMIGWGDILFLISLAFYLSLLNFIVFYLSSLVLILLAALICSLFFPVKKIPLAGWQALIFALLLAGNHLFFHWNLMNDGNWLPYLS